MPDLVPVESLRPGDEIILGRGGPHVVATVEEYEEACPCAVHAGAGPTVVVVYFKHGEATYENRARDKSGFNERAGMLVEQSLAPMRPGELVLADRGHPQRAVLLRSTLERQQQDRSEAQAERWRRASYAAR